MTAEPQVIELSEAAMRQVHAFIAGEGRDLAAIVERTRSAEGEITWRGVLSPSTVHHLGGLCALAAEEGARVDFRPGGLDERQTAFLTDYLTYGPAAQRRGVDGAGTAGAALSAAREAAYAAWQMRPRKLAPVRPVRGGKAVIIGAYGGDHVGDAAILGGVLLDLAARFGMERADVMSHRPAHTARLVRGLSTPLTVEVHDYTPAKIGDRLTDASLLVIAGGPVMDLPRVLAKHLAAAHLARALGIPFRIERVGVGPLKRPMSRWAARRLFETAQSISLRTAGAGRDPVLDGLAYAVEGDPAFDYLATRRTLDRTTEAVTSAEALLSGTRGRLLIGLNLRPIRHEWADQGAAFAREAESKFYDGLADGMRRLSEAADRPVSFIFFPMNPIEFGMSDLAAAYRLHKRLGNSVDLRVWEADPYVDDVLWLLRRLDGAMCMRFHAAIFALSQGLPAVGFDYYPGKGGKVEELFADAGRPDDARRIDAFTADWLVEKLSAVTAGKEKAGLPG